MGVDRKSPQGSAEDRRSLAAHARAAVVARDSPRGEPAKAGSSPATSRASSISQVNSPPESPKLTARRTGMPKSPRRRQQPQQPLRRNNTGAPPPVAKAAAARRGYGGASLPSSKPASANTSSASTPKLSGAQSPPPALLRRSTSKSSTASSSRMGSRMGRSPSSNSDRKEATDSSAGGPLLRHSRGGSGGSTRLGSPDVRTADVASANLQRRGEDKVVTVAPKEPATEWKAQESLPSGSLPSNAQPEFQEKPALAPLVMDVAPSGESSPMSVVTEAALTKSQYLLEQLADLKFGSDEDADDDEDSHVVNEADELKGLENLLPADQSWGLASLRSEVRKLSRQQGQQDTVEVPAVLLRMLGEMWEQVKKEQEQGSGTQNSHAMLENLHRIVQPKLQSSKFSSSMTSVASTMLPSPAADGEASAELLSDTTGSRALTAREWPRLSAHAPTAPSSPCGPMSTRATRPAMGIPAWQSAASVMKSVPGSPHMGSPSVRCRSMANSDSAVVASLQKATAVAATSSRMGYSSPAAYGRVHPPARAPAAPCPASQASQVAAAVAAAVARAVPPQRVQSMAALSGTQSVTVTTTITPSQPVKSLRPVHYGSHPLSRVHSMPATSFQTVPQSF